MVASGLPIPTPTGPAPGAAASSGATAGGVAQAADGDAGAAVRPAAGGSNTGAPAAVQGTTADASGGDADSGAPGAGDFTQLLAGLLGGPLVPADGALKPATPVARTAADGDDEMALPEEAGSLDLAAILAALGMPMPAAANAAATGADAAATETIDGAGGRRRGAADLSAAIANLLGQVRETKASADDTAGALPDALLGQLLDDGEFAADWAGSDADGLMSSLYNAVSGAQAATVEPEAGLPMAQRSLHTTVGTPPWADELGARLHLLSEKGIHNASLRLTPENLGPLEVQISVQDDTATVYFGAGNAETRAALEQALPRLRELFAAQGLNLAHSGVFQEPPQQFAQAAVTTGQSDGQDAEGRVTGDTETAARAIVRRGLVDTWA